jgi:hypothetical protein
VTPAVPEYAYVVKEFVAGLKVPTFCALFGQNITRPSGDRAPPAYEELPVIPAAPDAYVVNTPVAGLNTPTFVAFPGTKTTRPSGASTPPQYPDAVKIEENIFVAGLNIPT